MAERAGLEPAITGTKIPCLTCLATAQYHVLSHQRFRLILPIRAENARPVPSVASGTISTAASAAVSDEVFFVRQLIIIKLEPPANGVVDACIAAC